MKTKKLISLLLALTMLFACISIVPSVNAQSTTVYVNGEAETNGNGTKDSPYNTLLNAVKALQNSGGTIVVTGVTELPANAFVNKAKVTVTSLEGTTDYRGTLDAESGLVSGAYLLCKSTSPINLYSGSTAEVEFNNLNIVWAFNYTAINLTGRTLTYGENTRWYEQKTRNTDFYVDGFSESLRLYSTTSDKVLTKSEVSTFNSGAGSAVTKVITGERCELTTAGHIFNIDGYVKELHISSESNNSTSGKLTVDGDVKINVGASGTIAKLTAATAGSGNTKGLANQKLLKEITGALSIAINHGGAITKNELSLTSADYKINKMFIVNGAENLTVKNGEGQGSFVVETEADFNTAVMTDESGNRTVKFLNNKTAEFTLTESGTYSVALENIEIPKYTVTFKDFDGTQKDVFTAEEGSVITEFPEAPFREGYEFVMWSSDGENPVTAVSGTNTIANAVYRKESRKVVFVNGEVETNGDGKTPKTPFKTFANAANAVKSGGVIVVMGVTDIASIANTAPVLITSVYNSEDYRGSLNSDSSLSGAYLHHNSGSPYGVSSSARGFIEFDNINLLMRKQYGAINFAGHPFTLGSGVCIYEPTANDINCTTFRDATTFQLRSYGIETTDSGEETEILESTIDGKTKYNSYYLGARGKRTIPGRIITVNGKLNNLYVSNDIKGATQGLLSIKGDVEVTVNGSISNITTAVNSGVSGLDKFEGNLSVIVNPGGTLSNVKDEAKPTSGKYVRINVSEGGTVSHTEKSLEYKIELDKDSAYNYATVSNGEDSFDVLLGGGSGTFKLTSAGEYTVSYGTKSVYRVTYTDNVGENEIDDYYVSATDTEGLTINLPTLSKTSSERFLGWATSENADSVEYLGGESYTISGNTDFYAVWENIPTFTVTFMTEAEDKISDFTAYEGAKITFPDSKDYHKYGYTLLGWAEKDSDTLITEVPAKPITLYPVYKAKSGADTVVYLNGTKTENGDGKSPDTAFNHIQSAVDAVKTSGGTVIVTGVTSFRNSAVSPQISPTYNNSGDIIFTSYDKETGIDYRATYNEDTQKFTDGAYIYYTNGINLGQTTMTGSVTFENCILAKSKATYLNFDGHPATIGKGVSVYQGTDTFKASALQMRGLGESSATKSNPDGLFIALNGLDAGTYSFTVGGSGNAKISGIKLTVESDVAQGIGIGGNNGILTVNGDILINLYGDVGGLLTDDLVHESGNVTLILNNNTDASYTGAIPKGYTLRTVKCEDSFASLTHGKDASEIIIETEPTMYTHAEVYTSESVLYTVVPLDENHKAVLTLPEGSFTIGFTNDPPYCVSYDTLCDEKVEKQWHESESEFTVVDGVKNLGYLFDGWEYNGKIYKAGDNFVMPKENITFTAVWTKAPEITITLDSNGYGENPESVVNYIYEFEKLPILESEKAHFIGWSKDKNADTGVLNIQLLEDTTYYAIWSEEPYVYTLHGRYSDKDSAYLVHVFLEGENALSGSITLDASSALSFADTVDSFGVTTEITAPADGNSVNISWEAEEEEYRLSDKRLLFTAVYYGDKDKVSGLLPEDKVYAENAKANTEKADITAYGSVSGLVTLDSRELGNTANTGAIIYAIDTNNDIVFSAAIENVGHNKTFTDFEVTLPTGEYILKIVKSGYIQREISVNVSEGDFTISDSPMFGGDISDDSGLGDGVVNVDDFVRVLRGFNEEFRKNPKNFRAVDINEDRNINVTDLSIIKNKLSGYVSASPVIVYADELLSETAQKTAELISDKFSSSSKVGEAEENCIILTLDTSLKIRDWKITRNGTRIEIMGGSVGAVLHGAENLVLTAVQSGEKMSVPANLAYSFPYTFDEVTLAGNSLSEYAFVVPENDETANKVHSVIDDYLKEHYGYTLNVKSTKGSSSDKEILIGSMSDISAELEAENCEIKVAGTKLHIAYNGEYASDIAAYNFIEQVVSTYSEDYDSDNRTLAVKDGYSHIDADKVSTRFLLMSDTHIESDFLENGRDVYTGWKPDFQALTETYSYINKNFPDLTFGLLCGDQLNTGYAYQPEFLNAERDNYFRTLDCLDLHKNSKTEDNLTEKFDFAKTESFVERNVTYYYPELNSRVIAIQGNHDTGVEEFYRECAFTDGNTRFICFFASYIGLPAPEGQYKSTGKISDATIEFIEKEMKKASADERIEHIILVCHWAISQESNFTWPIYDACPENGYSDNRQRLLKLAEEYGCDFYINGHEHNPNYPIGKAGSLYNINIGSTTSRWAVVEIHNRKIVFDVYSTAVANKETGEITSPVAFVKRVEQELTPKAVLIR